MFDHWFCTPAKEAVIAKGCFDKAAQKPKTTGSQKWRILTPEPLGSLSGVYAVQQLQPRVRQAVGPRAVTQ
jgi:hypothetical protein